MVGFLRHSDQRDHVRWSAGVTDCADLLGIGRSPWPAELLRNSDQWDRVRRRAMPIEAGREVLVQTLQSFVWRPEACRGSGDILHRWAIRCD